MDILRKFNDDKEKCNKQVVINLLPSVLKKLNNDNIEEVVK